MALERASTFFLLNHSLPTQFSSLAPTTLTLASNSLPKPKCLAPKGKHHFARNQHLIIQNNAIKHQSHYLRALRKPAIWAGLALLFTFSLAGESNALAFQQVVDAAGSLLAEEPKNALSLPTWAIHVSSVAEWVIAMALVWQYGEVSGCRAWKGLSWAMVPLLGGAFCACTWHFFYNSETLEVLVLMQAGLTVVGNFTMALAAFRIYKSTEDKAKV